MIAVSGRLPELAQAELEALGASPNALGEGWFEVSNTPELGDTGSIVRLAEQAEPPFQGTVGISFWGMEPSSRVVRALKGMGARRVVLPQSGGQLTIGQILGNKLAKAGNAELLQRSGDPAWYQATWWPDYAGFVRRDREAPHADPVRGMLPPQLARTLVNLATHGNRGLVVVDPFCGEGRVLMEAHVLGYQVAGSDIDSSAVAATRENLEWLGLAGPSVEVCDAIQSPRFADEGYVVATEPFLGRPQKGKPASGDTWLKEVLEVHQGFVNVWCGAAAPPQRLVSVVPRLVLQHGELALLDHLEIPAGWGASRVATYARSAAIVQRDIVVLEQRPG